MPYNQFDTPAVIANIKLLDERLPGSMKEAAEICSLAQLLSGQQPHYFDPVPLLPAVKYTDEKLPGSMKKAALIYMLAQQNYGPHILDAGVATLNGGTPATVTVSSTSADTNNVVLLSYYSVDSTNRGTLSYDTVSDGVSFRIYSSIVGDDNKVSWLIIQG